MTTLHETILPSTRTRRITVLISGSGSNLQALMDAASTCRLPNAEITYVLSSRSNAYGLTRASSHSPPIPTSVCALKTFLNKNPGSTREDYDREVARRVVDSRPDLVVLAGWMHILSEGFLDVVNGSQEVPKAPALPPPGPDALPTQTEPSHSEQAGSSGSGSSSGSAAAGSGSRTTDHLQLPIPVINLHPALPGAFDGANAIGRAFEAFQKGEIKHTGVMVHRVVKEVDRGEPLVVREVEIKEGETLEQLEQRIHQVEHEIIVEGAKKVLEELEKEGR